MNSQLSFNSETKKYLQGFIAITLSAFLWSVAYADSSREQLQMLTIQLQQSPNDQALREKIIKLALELKPAPSIPEEARRAFVRGNTAFSEASNQDDYARAVQRYDEALLIAPWWGDPYFNSAKALELQKEYGRAIQSLKLFVLTGPPSDDARKAQDYSYALEDKQEKLAKDKGEEEQRKNDYQNKFGFLEGRWNVASTFHCSCAWEGKIYQWIDVIAIKDKSIFITNPSGDVIMKGNIEGDDYTSIKWVITDPDPQHKQNAAKDLLPDYPVAVTVDKPSNLIRWKEPSAERGYSSSWTWNSSNDVTLSR